MLIFYVTFDSDEAAQRICQHLLAQKLIACYNIFAMQSGYFWDGAICREHEFVGLLKTHEALENSVESAIAQLHPYEVPCIMRWRATANGAYEDWINNSVQFPSVPEE